MAEVVLVTGVSRYLGGRFARMLSTSGEVRQVIGVDVVPPTHDIGGTEFVRADIRNPVIAKVIERAGVDTVVHMNVIATPVHAGGRVSMKEINVIGTMQLLAACQKSAGVKRLVVKSTSSVYGASPKDPARFTEDTPAKVLPRAGWGKDSVEVEGYVRGFSRRRPDVDVAVLRFANAVGPGTRTALTDYFELPVAPTVLGFDPRLQFVHEDDLVEAMRLATVGEVTGQVNVAGDGVLTLSQALGMIGRPVLPVPGPATDAVAQAASRLFRVDLGPDVTSLLTYGRGLDTTRMRDGARPRARVHDPVGVRVVRARPPARRPGAGLGAGRRRRARGRARGRDRPRPARRRRRPRGPHPEGGLMADARIIPIDGQRPPRRPSARAQAALDAGAARAGGERERRRRRTTPLLEQAEADQQPGASAPSRAGLGPPAADAAAAPRPARRRTARAAATRKAAAAAPRRARPPVRTGPRSAPRTTGPRRARPTRSAAGWSRTCPPTSRRASSSAGSPRRWRSCAAASPATTRSTSTASTPSSPTPCCSPCCARCTGTGSGCRCAASRTSRRRAARSWSRTTPAQSLSTR